MKTRFSQLVKELQNKICAEAERIDGKERFLEDKWSREGGGGGITRVIQNGAVFEKGAVNTSEVHGKITPAIRSQLNITGENFYATGVSLILHPYNPMAPTSHANFRYFEVTDDTGKVTDYWFGGGSDLTPYYLFEEDAVHFHKIMKHTCDRFSPKFYPEFKANCDEYFTNHHRNGERRGVGGIFYDRLKPSEDISIEQLFDFSAANGEAFINAYFPIIEKRKDLPFTEEQQRWQLIRRGRYVEFNLIHDKGTLFGLKSNGRTESILVSLPLNVRFEYDFKPEANSEEEKLLNILLTPKNWV